MATDKTIKTVAGALYGDNKHTICRYDTENDRIVDVVAVRGRWLYVQKCRRPEMWGGIVLPDDTRDDTTFALVLAVGAGCGSDERKTLAHEPALLAERRKLRGWLPQIELGEITPGKTRVLCPDDHEWGIMRSPYDENEYFVHECIPLGVWDDE